MPITSPFIRPGIFIVDDSPAVVERLTLLLSELKHISVVGYAPDRAAALEHIHLTKPHVVILDINLKDIDPKLSGMNLLATLRITYPSMIIFMLTNHATSEYHNKCMELGADYFFDKSNDFEKIPEMLSKIYPFK